MNNDIYAEWLVKRKAPGYKIPAIIGMVILILIGLVACIVNTFGFIVLLIACGVAYVGNMFMKVEYEYVFVTNELEIDRILAQKYRKKTMKIEMSQVEKVASMKSHELDGAQNNPNMKKIDFTSRSKDANTYGILYTEGGQTKLILIEPNEAILKCMRSCAPRKVLLNG